MSLLTLAYLKSVKRTIMIQGFREENDELTME
jgi:hypothetical protein